MNTTLNVQITGFGRSTANVESITTSADAKLWREAFFVLRERWYGDESVTVDWRPLVEYTGDGPIALEVQVSSDPDGAVSFAELFFHDVFLLLNLAVPGSFGGVVTTLGDGAHRASEVSLSARVFEYAWATAMRNGAPSIAPLPLADVVRWQHELKLGTQQIASTSAAKALFVLLQLARSEENESATIVALGQALEAMDVHEAALEPFFALRNAIVHGNAPVLHPMADDALDDRIDEVTLDLVNAGDVAASFLVSALQKSISMQ
jgi:hypothetical protein